jgi:hypothetical protein
MPISLSMATGPTTRDAGLKRDAALTSRPTVGTLDPMLRRDVSAMLGASRAAVSRVVGVELILILPL